MNVQSRLILLVGALILVGVYSFPIWTIKLEAPQYPEGIGMYIWVDQITGHRQHDIRNINILNHYVGMKEIIPDEVPELEWMPYLFGALMVFGLAAAAVGRRGFLIAWLVAFVLLSVIGLIDFYLWGYDYGHNLDPRAPIKVPGASYQPPLIGSKQLLTIRSTSLPYTGSLFIGTSFLLGCLALYLDRKKQPVEVTI